MSLDISTVSWHTFTLSFGTPVDLFRVEQPDSGQLVFHLRSREDVIAACEYRLTRLLPSLHIPQKSSANLVMPFKGCYGDTAVANIFRELGLLIEHLQDSESQLNLDNNSVIIGNMDESNLQQADNQNNLLNLHGLDSLQLSQIKLEGDKLRLVALPQTSVDSGTDHTASLLNSSDDTTLQQELDQMMDFSSPNEDSTGLLNSSGDPSDCMDMVTHLDVGDLDTSSDHLGPGASTVLSALSPEEHEEGLITVSSTPDSENLQHGSLLSADNSNTLPSLNHHSAIFVQSCMPVSTASSDNISSQESLLESYMRSDDHVVHSNHVINNNLPSSRNIFPARCNKKFICQDCGAEFNRNWNLCRHQISLHGHFNLQQEGEKESPQQTAPSPSKRKRHSDNTSVVSTVESHNTLSIIQTYSQPSTVTEPTISLQDHSQQFQFQHQQTFPISSLPAHFMGNTLPGGIIINTNAGSNAALANGAATIPLPMIQVGGGGETFQLATTSSHGGLIESFQAALASTAGGGILPSSINTIHLANLPTFMLTDAEQLKQAASNFTFSIAASGAGLNPSNYPTGLITLAACPTQNSSAVPLPCVIDSQFSQNVAQQPVSKHLISVTSNDFIKSETILSGSNNQTATNSAPDTPSQLVNQSDSPDLNAPLLGPQYNCTRCGLQFNRVWNLQRHQQLVHSTQRSQPGRLIASKICPLCRTMRCRQYKQLIDHVRREHRISASIEQTEFESEAEFLEWKHDLETQSGTSFAQKCGSNEVKDSVNTYFACNRTGFYQSKASTVKGMLKKNCAKVTVDSNGCDSNSTTHSQDGGASPNNSNSSVWGWSVRMGATCTAFIRTAQNKTTGRIRATYCLTHLGH